MKDCQALAAQLRVDSIRCCGSIILRGRLATPVRLRRR
jgi:hypothetical protein